MNTYIYITTSSLVRAAGMFTQLVFEHSLRIRLVDKPEAESKDSKGAATGYTTGSSSGTSTPKQKDKDQPQVQHEASSPHGSEATVTAANVNEAASSTEGGHE
jgi:hypothetical protein